MLQQLYIQDFTIIDSLELDFNEGMTVLTGETGAGKSIIVDALAFVLGERGDSGLIRHDQERAEVAAYFDISALPDAQAWLHEQGLEDEGPSCLLRRSLGKDGRSKTYINGRPVPVSALRTLGAWLVDIHGQHEHQSLLHRDAQRQLLDDFAGHQSLVSELHALYRRWKSLNEQLQDRQQHDHERSARLELLHYQLKELDALAPAEGEWQALDDEHKRLSHAQHLLESGLRALHTLDDNEHGSVSALLQHSLADLEQGQHYDPQLSGPVQMLESARLQLREAIADLRRYTDSLELDPERLNHVEERIGLMHQLARKHHVKPEELPALHEQLRSELRGLDQSGTTLEELKKQLTSANTDFLALARKLSASRDQAARLLADKVTAKMQELGMAGGRFAVVLSPRHAAQYAPTGMEDVEFQVSANPGQPLKTLSKVASGGELSRISLAIQVITAGGTHVPTLIFDEVDVGIGGGTAEIVGTLLRHIGATRQVLCVTHLPQVAALGHHHLQVSKQSNGGTHTRIRPLSEQDRYEEIARMLGGVEITEQTRAHAREMITRAQKI